MAALLGGAAAIATWLAWLALSPVFGLPETAPAAMFDRLFSSTPEASWRGWLVLLSGESVVVALYVLAIRRKLVSPGLVPALGSAIAVWLVTGALVMPLMGAVSGPAAPGDAMRASFMMLHLGPLAPLSALVGRLLYGAVLGSSARVWAAGT